MGKITHIPIQNAPKTGKYIVIHTRGKGKHKVSTFDAKKLKGGSKASLVGSAMTGTGAVMIGTSFGASAGAALTVAGGATIAIDSVEEFFDWW